MGWISVKDELPVIPKGWFAIQVIGAAFDSIYEEINPGKGHDIQQLTFNGKFRDWYCTNEGECKKINPVDPVTHWMYLPKNPINYDPFTGF